MVRRAGAEFVFEEVVEQGLILVEPGKKEQQGLNRLRKKAKRQSIVAKKCGRG
jgi:hypothetical protein